MRKLFSENIFFENTCFLITQVGISEINISADQKVRLQNLKNVLKMDSSDEEMLLESCSFLLNYHHKQTKSKSKRT